MARVTVEDCVQRVSSRFDLVMMAAQRARAISAGSEITIERDNDKNPVVALREIAEKTIQIEELEEMVIRSQQRLIEVDDPGEEEQEDLGSIKHELSGDMPTIDDTDQHDQQFEAESSLEEQVTKDSEVVDVDN